MVDDITSVGTFKAVVVIKAAKSSKLRRQLTQAARLHDIAKRHQPRLCTQKNLKREKVNKYASEYKKQDNTHLRINDASDSKAYGERKN